MDERKNEPMKFENTLHGRLDKIHEICEKLAKRHCWSDHPDEFNPMDFSGGNFDDAYFGGVEDGKAELARELLNMLQASE